MKYYILVGLTLLLASTSSCIKYVNLLNYQQDESIERELYLKNDYKLRPNDMLSIRLYEANGNLLEIGSEVIQDSRIGGRNMMNNTAGIFFTGYQVNDSGYVDLPFVSQVKAEGYTVEELELIVNKKYAELSKYGYYRIRLSNMKVTVSGEVIRPGVQYIYDTRYTLIQAISQAGDFTPTANRSKVIVIREIEGHSKMFELDLSKTDFISSPAYYLQPYDVIYVEPLKAKALNVNSQTISVIISSISVLIAVTSFVISNTGN